MNESHEITPDITATTEEIESFKKKLNDNRITEFVESLKSEDWVATRHNLIALISPALKGLLDVEREFVTESMGTEEEGLCPHCLALNIADAVRVEGLINSFNQYLLASESEPCDG